MPESQSNTVLRLWQICLLSVQIQTYHQGNNQGLLIIHTVLVNIYNKPFDRYCTPSIPRKFLTFPHACRYCIFFTSDTGPNSHSSEKIGWGEPSAFWHHSNIWLCLIKDLQTFLKSSFKGPLLKKTMLGLKPHTHDHWTQQFNLRWNTNQIMLLLCNIIFMLQMMLNKTCQVWYSLKSYNWCKDNLNHPYQCLIKTFDFKENKHLSWRLLDFIIIWKL